MSLTRNYKLLFNNLRISFGHILILYHQDHAFLDSREDEEEKRLQIMKADIFKEQGKLWHNPKAVKGQKRITNLLFYQRRIEQ